MRKKLLVMGLCVALATSMVACSADKKESNKTATSKEVETDSDGNYTASKMASTIDDKDFKYVGLEVGKSTEEVDDETFNKAIDNILSGFSTSNQITEGVIKEGDVTNIDYVGKIDGVEFEGGTGSGFDLEIGSHSFIEGFESGLVGKNVGETVVLDLTFPEDYNNTTTINGETVELNGKPVQFEVKINYITETVLPELTDDFVAQNCSKEYGDSKTVDELNKYVKDQIVLSNKVSAIWPTLLSDTNVSIDPVEEQSKYDELYSYYENIISSNYNTTVDEYVTTYANSTVEEFEKSLHDEAKSQIKSQVISDYIAREENITATTEEYDEKAKDDMEYYGYETIEEYEKQYPKADVIDRIIYYKVLEFIADNAKVVDDSATEAATEAATEVAE